MKLSKRRAKARSVFAMRKRVQYRWDSDGAVHETRPDDGSLCTEIAVIRGRPFTRPQCAVITRGA